MKLSSSTRAKVAAFLPRHAVPILCASIGRVGSTLVRRSLARGRTKSIFGFTRLVCKLVEPQQAWNLKGVRFNRGAVYKTHDFPYDLPANADLKVVFLYGRPSDSILSVIRRRDVKGPEWIVRHFDHMHAYGSYDELLSRDVMRIEEQIDAWSTTRKAEVLGLRYDTLWDNIGVLRKFVGFPVELPPRIERNFLDMDPGIVALARAGYHSLDIRVAKLPDYFRSARL
jgi:hypothetical protein